MQGAPQLFFTFFSTEPTAPTQVQSQKEHPMSHAAAGMPRKRPKPGIFEVPVEQVSGKQVSTAVPL